MVNCMKAFMSIKLALQRVLEAVLKTQGNNKHLQEITGRKHMMIRKFIENAE